MPEALPPPAVNLLIGGEGSVRFGVVLNAIGRVLEHAELPASYRSVNVPKLFGAADLDRMTDRYAEVPAAGADAHLRLGTSTTVEAAPADRLDAVPRILDRTAARWGWSGLWLEGEHVVVVLDAARLSTIGATRTRKDPR